METYDTRLPCIWVCYRCGSEEEVSLRRPVGRRFWLGYELCDRSESSLDESRADALYVRGRPAGHKWCMVLKRLDHLHGYGLRGRDSLPGARDSAGRKARCIQR